MSIDSSFATKEEFEHNAIPDVAIPDATAAKSPETLEREIDARRANIETIVDALENRFSPGQLIDQALAFTKGGGGEFFTNLGISIKNNPVPVLLTTVGVTWLMLGQNQAPRSNGQSMFGHLGEKISDAAESISDSLGNAKDHLRQSAHQISDKAEHLADAAGEKLSDMKDRATSATSSATAKMKSTSDTSQDALMRQGRQLQGSFQYMLQEQPLALAAIGIALGAAIGAALPSTQQENKILGQTSDKLTAKAKSTLNETWGAVSDAGKEMVEDLKHSAPSNSGSSSHVGN